MRFALNARPSWPERLARFRVVHALRQDGLSYRAIADRLGVSMERVRQLDAEYRRHLARSERKP